MALLEVVTRTFLQRPNLLARNLESLTLQTDSDWSRTLVVDAQARGCAWACANLATVEAVGDYVWVLDDDDLCCRNTLVAELRSILDQETLAPDVIMVRAYHGKFGTLPSDATWLREPVCGKVGTSCYIIRRDVWNATHHLWREVYEADFWYIYDLWHMPGLRWYWHDHTAAYYPQQSIGAPDAR